MSKKRSPHPPPAAAPQSPAGKVVDLGEFRDQRKLFVYQDKIARVVDSNRRAIGRLYSTGALFSREGVKVGRDLLMAHQHLLKVVALLGQLTDTGALPAPRKGQEVTAVFQELDQLLERTSMLTSRTGHYLARLQPE